MVWATDGATDDADGGEDDEDEDEDDDDDETVDDCSTAEDVVGLCGGAGSMS